MTTMPVTQEFQVVLDIVGTDAMTADELEAIAEAVLDEVETKAAFVAMGPVVSVDFPRQAIEIECHVSGETAEDVYNKMSRITDVMLEAASDPRLVRPLENGSAHALLKRREAPRRTPRRPG